jgi:hypothetical protein
MRIAVVAYKAPMVMGTFQSRAPTYSALLMGNGLAKVRAGRGGGRGAGRGDGGQAKSSRGGKRSWKDGPDMLKSEGGVSSQRRLEN